MGPGRLRLRIAVTMVAVITLLAGCGRGDTTGAPASTGSTGQDARTTPAGTTAALTPPLTTSQAEKALVKISELPEAWSAVDAAPGDVLTAVSDHETITPKELCDGLAGPVEATDLAAASFVQGDVSKGTFTGSSLHQRIYVMKGGLPPSTRLDRARDALGTCTTYMLRSSITGETSRWRVQALPFPAIGGGVVAWRAVVQETWAGPTINYITDNVVVSVRGVVMRFTAQGMGSAPLPGQDLAELVAATVSRAEHA